MDDEVRASILLSAFHDFTKMDHSAMNLQMITLLNAKERTLRDWTELFLKADPRLVISTVSKPTGSQTSIIEVVLKGQSVDGFGSRL